MKRQYDIYRNYSLSLFLFAHYTINKYQVLLNQFKKPKDNLSFTF